MTRELRGVFPVLNTTFNDDGSLDFSSQENLVRYLIEQQGASGLGLFANASEGYALEDRFRIEWSREPDSFRPSDNAMPRRTRPTEASRVIRRFRWLRACAPQGTESPQLPRSSTFVHAPEHRFLRAKNVPAQA